MTELRKNTGVIAAALLALLFVGPNYATTVERLGFQDVVERSELIVEGTVESVHSEYDTERRYIWTHVRIRVSNTIKGDPAGDEITLKFVGGTVNDLTLKVPSMNYPAVGDSGMYFVESPSRAQLHPLTGWDQGHYKVASDGTSGQHITTPDGLPVLGIRQTQPPNEIEISAGIARGVEVARPQRAGQIVQSPMQVTAFRALVEALAREGNNEVPE